MSDYPLFLIRRLDEQNPETGWNWWERVDTGERRARARDFGPGATWYMPWLTEHMGSINGWTNWPEGQAPMTILTPGGDWMPESRASNCTMKDEGTHRCWVLHGEDLNLTADKNGHTCAAGAGSIQCNDYHGFLRGGALVQ